MSSDFEPAPLDGLPMFKTTTQPVALQYPTKQPPSWPKHQPTPDVAFHPRRADPAPAEVTPLRTRVEVHQLVQQVEGIDWDEVDRLRAEVSTRMSEVVSAKGGIISRDEELQLGQRTIKDIIDQESRRRAQYKTPWGPTAKERMYQALIDAVFGLGRLQPLVDAPDVENILVNGFDKVLLETSDGRQIPGPPVASSDEKLIEYLSFVASRDSKGREFSESHPSLHMRLPGGSRLAATAWVTTRPSVVIRRHRHPRVTLRDLVRYKSIDRVAASFLSAAVKSGRSIVVSGGQGAGKTTMVRALCAEIPRHEVLGVFETEYELGLDQLPDQHETVFTWEARPGTGEMLPHGGRAGEFTVAEALLDSFRFNLNRQIVGEVRGPEVLAMIKAMQSSQGSISTTHANHGLGAIEKLVTCALEAGAHITQDYAVRAISEAIDIVVQLGVKTDLDQQGNPVKHRWVSEIVHVSPGESQRGYATTTIFKCQRKQRTAIPWILPDELRELVDDGFLLQEFLQRSEEVRA